jgi:DNA-binding PadR family transcriptional regulator
MLERDHYHHHMGGHKHMPTPARGPAGFDWGGGRHGRHRGGPGGPDGDLFESPRGRARRGEARVILLDILRDGPKHGYEIIKSFEERSGGAYAPSPGTVYPTMEYLEELGLVASDQGAERRVFRLTEAGLAELDAHASQVAEFWARFGKEEFVGAGDPEIDFLREEVGALIRTVRSGVRAIAPKGDTEAIRRIRQSVERCQAEIRDLISTSTAKPADA